MKNFYAAENGKKEGGYQSPSVTVLNIQPEGLLCASKHYVDGLEDYLEDEEDPW